MLSAELARQVRQINIRTRRLVDGVFAGEYHSVFKGRGLEFAEVREYVPGDDVRTIDWNVTARMGIPFVKRYVEERELTVMLLVDVSSSVQFGSSRRLKTEVIAELCAVLALSALRNNDKVGMILFSNRIERYLPPQKGKNRALRVIRELLEAQPERRRATDVNAALRRLYQSSTRRTVSFLISDFLDAGYERWLHIVHGRHDLIPISVSDRREFDLPRVGLLRLKDLETGAELLIDTYDQAQLANYRANRAEALARQRRLFMSLGLDYIEVRTDESVLHPLLRFFRMREGRQ